MKKTNTDLLSDLICTFYCAEDFQEWISELADPDTEKVARERICEGLAALKISFNKHGDNEHLKRHVLYHINKSHMIKSYQELEEDFLLALFERWISDEGQKLHKEISNRKPDAGGTLKEYYECSFIYFGDDIGRIGGGEGFYNLLFDEEHSLNKAKQLLSSGVDESIVQDFINCLNTVDDLLENKKVKNKYGYTKEPSRKYILYLTMVWVISCDQCFGRENHRSLMSCFMAMNDTIELSMAGYPKIDLNNCLDSYLVFSAYRYMMTCLPKRKQIVPGRENTNA